MPIKRELTMKKLTNLVLAGLLAGTLANAESYPAEGPESYKIQHDSEAGYGYEPNAYLGLAYTYMNLNVSLPGVNKTDRIDGDIQGDSLTILLGYDFHRYMAVEARYTKSIGNLNESLDGYRLDKGSKTDGDMSNMAGFIKPKLESDNIALYGLIGYGKVEIDSGYVSEDSDASLQWGLGISVDAGKDFIGKQDISFFFDYLRLYDNKEVLNELTVDSFTFGLNYNF